MPAATTVAQLQVVVGADVSDVERQLGKLGKDVQGFGTSMQSVFAGIGAGIGFKAFDLIADGIKTATDVAVGFNSKMEQSTIAFTSMLGSAEKAQAFLDDMKQFAATTPFEFPDLLDASKKMLAFGFAAKDVRPLLTAVGSAAAAMGTGKSGVESITTALGQMRAATTVQAGELNQLTEQGVPAFQILADAMHISTGEVKKLAGQGKIASDVFITAFQNWAKNNYGDMMAKQALTFEGAISTIKDSLTFAIADAFKPFFALLSAGAIQLANFVQTATFTEWAHAVAASIDGLVTSIGTLLGDLAWVTAALAGIETADYTDPWDALAGAIDYLAGELKAALRPAMQWVIDHSESITTAFAGAAAAIATLVAAGAVVPIITAVGSALLALLSPIALVAAAGAALALAWQNNWFGIRDTTATVVDWLVTTVWPGLQFAMNTLAIWIATTLIPTFGLVTSWLFDKVGATLTWLTTTAWPLVQAAMATVGAWIMGTLVPTLTAAWSWLSEKLGAAMTWLTEKAWPLLGEAANKVQNWITETLIPTLTEWYTWFDQKLSPIYTWFTEKGWPLLQKAGETVWAWITGPLATALHDWWSVLQESLAPVFTWFTTTGWPKLQEAGTVVWQWITGPLATALHDWWDVMQNSLSPIFTWFTTTGWPNFQTAGAFVWTWLTTNMIPAWQSLWHQMEELGRPAAQWWIDNLPKLKTGFADLNPEVAQGASDWNAFADALSRTDAGESWVAILANFARFGKYLIENIHLGDWFNDITNGAAAASGWAEYIAEAVAWILRTIKRWSDAFPGQRSLPDVEEPPKAPPGGSDGGGPGGGGGSIPEPPGITQPPLPQPTPPPGGGTPTPLPEPTPPNPLPGWPPSPAPSPSPGSGVVFPPGAAASSWQAEILAAASSLGVPAAVIASIMDIESGGSASAQSPMNKDRNGNPIGRAQGLMQVMPFHWSEITLLPSGEATAEGGAYMREPTRNVNKGASILASEFARHGSSWKEAARYYFGVGTDVGGQTDTGYVAAFMSKLSMYGGANLPQLARGGWAGLHGPELAWLGERGPEYVVPNAALRGGGSAGPMQTIYMPIVLGNRVIEEAWITGRDLAIRRGRVPGAGAASMGSLA